MKRFLLCLLAALAAPVLPAGELEIAKSALRDGLWEIARIHASRVQGSEARLVIVESYAREGKWGDVLKTLDAWSEEQGDGFVYYRALALARTGAFEKAERVLEAALDESAFVDPDVARQALVLRADLAKRAGRPKDVLIYASDAAFPTNDMAALSLVAWAKSMDGDMEGARDLWRRIVADANAPEDVVAAAATSLGDVETLRAAHARMVSASLKRAVGLRLGRELLADEATFEEGAKMIKALAKDSPDAVGARTAFLALADACLEKGRSAEAADLYRQALEAWPEAAKELSVQEGYAWALRAENRLEESLAAFMRAEEVASESDAEGKALALMAQGELLTELGRGAEAMAKYRVVLTRYPGTPAGLKLKVVMELGELEASGRAFYRDFNFTAAQLKFAELARRAPEQRARMAYFDMLCLYGLGRDEEAVKQARRLASEASDPSIRAEATLWLAKYSYNARDWDASRELFEKYATTLAPTPERASFALCWAVRAAFSAGDYPRVIALVAQLTKEYPSAAERTSAWLIQGEALSQLARLDEAVAVFEKIILSNEATPEELFRARRLKADVLFVMGADNPTRYGEALRGYRALLLGESLTLDDRLDISYKIGHTLEKLGKMDEALDQYYSQVVLVYRENCESHAYEDRSKGTFARAAFRLADEFERRGEDERAKKMLRLVTSSGISTVGAEARRRLERLKEKGSMR